MRCLDDSTDSKDMSLNKLREMVKDREACSAAAHEVTKNQTQLSNRTTKFCLCAWFFYCSNADICLTHTCVVILQMKYLFSP